MSKVKYIDKSQTVKCLICGAKDKSCKVCKGTGKRKRDNYYLVYTDKNGQKLGFQVDGIK